MKITNGLVCATNIRCCITNGEAGVGHEDIVVFVCFVIFVVGVCVGFHTYFGGDVGVTLHVFGKI